MGKKKTTQTETSKTVATPTNPDWITQPTQDLAGRIGGLSTIDPNSLIAGLSDRESAAFGRADSLGVDNDWFDKALSSNAPTVQSASLLEGLDRYMSPYTQQVVDTALADFDHGAGQTRAQQELDLAGSGAFGGSGSAITRSMTEDALTRGRASTSATLRDQAFNVGANLSNQDAQRRQAAAEANAQLGLQHTGLLAELGFGRDANERANIATQAGAGATEREIAQQRALAPYTQLQLESGLLGSLPLNLFHGQEQNTDSTTKKTQSGGLLESLGTLAMGAGALGFAPFTGGASLLGLGATGGLGAAASGLAARSAMGGLAGDKFFGRV